MRVIAGSARRLLLKSIEGRDTRPTTDRIKETLFNMINDDVYNCVFVDLFSGTGGIGIEALSRGARTAVFVEKNRKAIDCINYNLNHTKLMDKARVISGDAVAAVDRLASFEHVDIIFMDPPYNMELENEVLKKLIDVKSVDEDTLIIIEADINTDFDFVTDLGYNIQRVKNYKTNKHIFLKKN